MKRFKFNRREILLSIIALIIYPSTAFPNKSNLNNRMKPKYMGSKDAPIKIKEYFSLTCGHCASFHIKTLPKFKKKYIDSGQVQLELIDYPLDRLAVIASALVRTIPTDEGYLGAVKTLLRKQKIWAYSKEPLEELASIAKSFGISSSQFKKITQNFPLMQEIINKMEMESKKFKITSTPTFIVNDKHKISGALTFREFESELLKFLKIKNS